MNAWPEIAPIPLITEQVRLPDPRLWTLIKRENEGTATAAELAELDALCAELEKAND